MPTAALTKKETLGLVVALFGKVTSTKISEQQIMYFAQNKFPSLEKLQYIYQHTRPRHKLERRIIYNAGLTNLQVTTGLLEG